MIKQTLMFKSPSSLSLRNNQLVISFKEGEDIITRPIEDIGFVVIENPMVKLTVPLLNALIGSGLFPAFGIFHRNRYNAFPLADDIMEPYRPFVDEVVYQLYEKEGVANLTHEAKGRLLRILIMDIKMKKITRPLEVALSYTTASLLKVFKGEDEKVSYPILE